MSKVLRLRASASVPAVGSERSSEAVAAEERTHGRLRRELRFWEAIAISVGIMAPTAAMALNGVAPAGLVGRAVPLAFLFAAIAIALISYSFVRLTRFFNHAGSAYALSSESGWMGVRLSSQRAAPARTSPGATASRVASDRPGTRWSWAGRFIGS